jgi:DNA-binding LacI/PurR family transcriptional regulator
MTTVSIVDIARLAEVSPSTVSRALQDHPRISPERRAEIQRLAESLGYRPNQMARGLVTGRSHMLGAVVTDVTDPFVAEVLKGAAAAARDAGYGLLFAMSHRDPAQEVAAAETLLEHDVDGLVVISSRVPDRYADLARGGDRETGDRAPVVLINNELAGSRIFSVQMDNAGGAREAVAYLRQLGHRRIAFVAGPAGGRSNRKRLAGYLQGIEANGLGPAAELIVSGGGLLEDGPRALAALMALSERPTAVLCYNDLAAIGLLAAAARAGLHVPGELSVVGFDNIPLSAYATPPLTTFEQPTGALGRAAVRSCLAALAGAPAPDVILSGKLIVRESTAQCAAPADCP